MVMSRDANIGGMNDQQLLASIPDFLSIESMFKATPAEEAGRRYIYIEASNENVDQQGERVMSKALAESAAHFLKFGNIDIDHYTLIGKPNPSKGWAGIPNCESYEIGRPVDVKIGDGRTFVKAELYCGDAELAKNANMVWESMTKLSPPARWYPSVGGQVMAKSTQIDPDTKDRVAVITKVRWTNIALSRTPVNQNVPTAQTVPFGALAKSWTPNGLMLKTLEAGYGTDSAALAGGAALRKQSLHGAIVSYWDFREKLAAAVRGRKNPGAKDLVDLSVNKFGLSFDEAAEWVERFMRDLKSGLTQRRKS